MAQAPGLGQKLAAEAFGTFSLVLFGVGAALMSGGDYAVTALSFGFTVLVMVAAFGRVSGGHFNPAVSMGAALAGRLSWREAGVYGLTQVGGGAAGGLLLWTLMTGFPGFDPSRGFGQNAYGDQSPGGYAWWAALLLELVLTSIFVVVVLAMTDARHGHPALAPVAIGLSLTVIHFASISATGTSVNPARSIGAGLFAGADAIGQLWLFVLAPMLGGALAGLAYPLVFGRAAAPTTDPAQGRTGSGSPASTPQPPLAPESWSTPGPPREWGQPAPPVPPPTWRPPAGVAGGPSAPASDSAASHADTDAEDSWQAAGFPVPKEPYWSQQLPPDWELPEDGDDHTQIRPNDGP